MSIRVRLEEEDFRALVAGDVVKQKDIASGREIEVILADIGFGPMENALDDAIASTAAKSRGVSG